MTSPTGEPDRRSGRTGFSLLELILVLALLALAAALATPTLSRFTRRHLSQDCATDLLVLTRYAQDHAARQATPYRLHVDPEARIYHLTAQRGGTFVAPANDLGRIFDLPMTVVAQWESPSAAQQNQYVQFNPDGTHEPAVLLLIEQDGRTLRLVGDAITEPFRLENLPGGVR